MSSPTPRASNGATTGGASPTVVYLTTRVESFLLTKGGWVGGLGMLAFWGFEAATKWISGDKLGFLHNCGLMCLALTGTVIMIRGRRNSSMTAQGIAEVKEALPGVTIPSADPAIRRAEETVISSQSGGRVLPRL